MTYHGTVATRIPTHIPASYTMLSCTLVQRDRKLFCRHSSPIIIIFSDSKKNTVFTGVDVYPSVCSDVKKKNCMDYKLLIKVTWIHHKTVLVRRRFLTRRISLCFFFHLLFHIPTSSTRPSYREDLPKIYNFSSIQPTLLEYLSCTCTLSTKPCTSLM